MWTQKQQLQEEADNVHLLDIPDVREVQPQILLDIFAMIVSLHRFLLLINTITARFIYETLVSQSGLILQTPSQYMDKDQAWTFPF